MKEECKCTEFEYVIPPDETGAIIIHKECRKMQFVEAKDLEEWKRAFPNMCIADFEKEEPKEDALDSQEFYELMQAYRHAPWSDQTLTTQRFEAIKKFIRHVLTGI